MERKVVNHPEGVHILEVKSAYNEEGHIGSVVSQVLLYVNQVLVVDDHSTDNTASEAESAGAHVVRLPINLGYGCALQTGYRYARNMDYDILVQLDGDGQHDTNYIPNLLAPILDGKADIVMGSRFLSGSISYPVPMVRRLGQKLFSLIAGKIIGQAISDPTTGFQALSKSAVQTYCTPIFPDDYPDADLRIILHRLRYRVLEIPVQMHASENKSMHGGFIKPIYYIFKMFLSIFLAAVRPLPGEK